MASADVCCRRYGSGFCNFCWRVSCIRLRRLALRLNALAGRFSIFFCVFLGSLFNLQWGPAARAFRPLRFDRIYSQLRKNVKFLFLFQKIYEQCNSICLSSRNAFRQIPLTQIVNVFARPSMWASKLVPFLAPFCLRFWFHFVSDFAFQFWSDLAFHFWFDCRPTLVPPGGVFPIKLQAAKPRGRTFFLLDSRKCHAFPH